MKFGIISFAHMHAYSYARALGEIAGVTLAGVADPDPERGPAAAQQFGATYYRDYQELLAQDIDAVIICSANADHKEHAIAAAQAGKHILCEKPISVSVPDARAMIEAAEKAGVVLQTAFPVRHSNPVRLLKAAIDDGKLGEIVAINATNHGKMPPGWFLDPAQAGGGAVMDHTVHVADLVRWMLKTEFTRVYAEVDTLLHDVGIDDCGMLTADLASGAFMSLDPSWSRPDSFTTWGDVTMQVIGTKGVASLDAFRQAGMVYVATSPNSPGRVFENGWGNDADRELIEAFIAAVKGEPNEGASGLDGLKAMELALAAYESANRAAPVALPLSVA